MRRLDMLKAREILRLKHEVGLSSLRDIGQACNCGKSSVAAILSRAKKAGITWPIALGDKQLMSKLYPPTESEACLPEPDMSYVFNEMKKKNVTLMLLWEEYKEKHPEGIMYSQFCDRYRKFKKNNQISMRKEHKAGEEVEVDWAGDTMSYADPNTGEIKKAYLFVAVLPASSYPFVYAYEDQKTPSWIDAHVRAFEFYGGVPKVTIPDNTKTAVVKSDRIDPVVNKTYHEMARYYRTTIVPARGYRPKDKAADENMVGHVSRRIIAALRNRQFFSLCELNQAISDELMKLIDKPFQKMEGNRRTAFEQIDQPCLQSLPATRYEVSDWKETKVQFNYHVEYDRFFYSVHFSYVNRPCSIRATSKTIEVFVGSERIAAYQRNYNRARRYITLPEHMPEEHKIVSGWSSERFLSWAEKIGPHTKELIQRVLVSREHATQTYRSCMGIMRFGESYPVEAMEQASREAVEKNACSFKYFSIILKQTVAQAEKMKDEKIIRHDNVRGSSAYERGGIHA